MSRFPDTPIENVISVERRLAERLACSGKSVREIAKLSGLSKTRIGNIANLKAKITVEDVQRLGCALRFNPSNLLDINPSVQATSESAKHHFSRTLASIFETSLELSRELGQGVDFTEVLRWHRQNSGRLEGYDKIRPFVGVYSVKLDDTPIVEAREIGISCLAAKSLHASTPEQVNQYIRSLGRCSREEISYTYLSANNTKKYQLFERDVIVDFPGAGPKYRLIYSTLLLPVRTPNGEDFVMNFSSYLDSELLP